MENKKAGNLSVRIKDNETGEEGYVKLEYIAKAIFECLEEQGYLKWITKNKKQINQR